jgi:hypothetical protein
MYWKVRMTSNLGKLQVAERQIYYESDETDPPNAGQCRYLFDKFSNE